MYNIFEDLDKQIPGVKVRWINRVRHSHFYDFYSALAMVGIESRTYQPYKEEIYKICNSRREKFIAFLMLNCPLGGLTVKMYSKILTLWRILTRKVAFVRKTNY